MINLAACRASRRILYHFCFSCYSFSQQHFQDSWIRDGNVVEAHIKAAEALVREAAPQKAEPGNQVGGESFFITNDDPRHFYDFMRLVWQATGYDTSSLTPTIIPSKVALAAASISDLATWAFTLGSSSSSFPSKEDIEHLCLNRTHDISKARKVLGYSPAVTIEEGIRRGVRSLCYDY